MRRILKFFENILRRHIDKVAHFAITYGLVYTLADKWDINGAIAVGILVGVAKEFYDLYIKKSKFSIGDLVADAFGIALAFWIVGV